MFHSFEQTIIPHRHAAQNLARWLTRNESDAEDIVQEAYLRAFRFFDSFHGGDGKAWLLAVVRNTYLSWTRREKRRPQTVAFDTTAHDFDRSHATVEQLLVNNSNLNVLRDCLDTLQSDYRDILVMREFEDMSYREIAEEAAIPLGTVMSRLSRARAQLGHVVNSRTRRSECC